MTFSPDENDNNQQDGNEFLATENPYYHHTGDLGFNSMITSSNIVDLEDTEVGTVLPKTYIMRNYDNDLCLSTSVPFRCTGHQNYT